VSRDRGELHWVQSALSQAADRFMAQIVETQADKKLPVRLN
jgi:hypothetical protein